MHASLFEIWKLTQRTLEGAGVSHGHDCEGAFAVQWLVERGFPGFEMFGLIDIGNAYTWRLMIQNNGILQAAQNPMVFLGVDVIDYCVAAAVASGSAKVIIEDLKGPAFLLPFAARRCLNIGTFRLQWSGANKAKTQVIIEGAEAIWIDGGVDFCDMETPVNVTISFYENRSNLQVSEGVIVGNLINPEILRNRREKCISNGIEVVNELWDRMQAMARTVLVPATEQSRKLGAGGGDAND